MNRGSSRLAQLGKAFGRPAGRRAENDFPFRIHFPEQMHHRSDNRCFAGAGTAGDDREIICEERPDRFDLFFVINDAGIFLQLL